MTEATTPAPRTFVPPAAPLPRVPALWNVPLPTKQARLVQDYNSPEFDDIPDGMYRLWTRRFGEYPVSVLTNRKKKHDHYNDRMDALRNPTDIPNLEEIENAIRLLNADVQEQRVFPRDAKPQLAKLRAMLDDARVREIREEEITAPTSCEWSIFADRMNVKLRDYFRSVDPLEPLCNHKVAQRIGTNREERNFVLGFFQAVRALRQDLPELYRATGEGENIFIVIDLETYRVREQQQIDAENFGNASDLDRRSRLLLERL